MKAVVKLLKDIGPVAEKAHNELVRNVPAQKVQCDEMWTFCYAKDKNLPAAKAAPEEAGSIWTWTAIESDTRLIISWLVSCGRDGDKAYDFMLDLKNRIMGRIQLTTDGWRHDGDAVNAMFHSNVDYTQYIKYKDPEHQGGNIKFHKKVIAGQTEAKDISTTYAERQNLTMRTHMRRNTRLSLGFSKRIYEHRNMTALYFLYYNFCRVHRTLKTTPAVASGLAEYPRDISWIVELLDN